MKAYEDGPIGRFLSAFGTYSPNQEGVRWTAIGQAQDNEAVRQNHAQVLQAEAAGVVVLGRNATAILADRPGTLHVKLIGQLADRLARAARVDGIDAATAARRQKNEDRHRAQLTHSSTIGTRPTRCPSISSSTPRSSTSRRARTRSSPRGARRPESGSDPKPPRVAQEPKPSAKQLI